MPYSNLKRKMGNGRKFVMINLVRFALLRTLVLFAATLAFSASLAAQAVIENPAKPLSGNAGRLLALQEIWRITDESGQFFLQSPSDFQVAEDDTVFLADVGQLLRFSSEGKFIKSLCRKGAGPGEIQDWIYFCLHGKDLFIWSPPNRRFWRADLNGAYQEDIPLPFLNFSGFLGVLSAGFLFQTSLWPPFEQRTGKLMDILESVVLIGKNGKEQSDIYGFRSRYFLTNGAARSWDYSIAILSSDAKRVFAYHGRDYLVEVLDLGKKQVVQRFRRPYPKVPHVEQPWEIEFQKKHGSPKIEYESDITNLFIAGPNLWVETSTVDKGQGFLFDVFSPDGRWLDNFFLGAGKTLLRVWEDCLFTVEKNADETFRIIKYRIKK